MLPAVLVAFNLYLSSTPEIRELITRSGSLPDSIGISPPRLLYGRAASYGSIMIPCVCHRLNRYLPGIGCVGVSRSRMIRSWRTHSSGLASRPTQVTYVINVYSVVRENGCSLYVSKPNMNIRPPRLALQRHQECFASVFSAPAAVRVEAPEVTLPDHCAGNGDLCTIRPRRGCRHLFLTRCIEVQNR